MGMPCYPEGMLSVPLQRWSDRLERAARATLGESTSPQLDALVKGELAGLPMAALVSRSLGAVSPAAFDNPIRPDERLWASLAGLRVPPEPPTAPSGPITGENESVTIEVWTETELACVHAAWSLGGPWRDAARASAFWLLEHIQPDNATNHPWAVHAFAAFADETDNPELDLYAQSLLHNCMVTAGRPDTYSALILLHAARSLQTG